MQSTALRATRKINSNVLQNSRRLFSFKFEMTPASRLIEQTEEVKEPKEPPPETAPNFRYSVCQPRTTPVDRASLMGDADARKQTARAHIEEQQLQPSMLPQYFQKNMDRSVLVNPPSEAAATGAGARMGSVANQRFQVSKTYANAILPLKNVKLANPFPEPVKMMMSRTVSDEEKAEQMLAESKSQRAFAESPNKPMQRSFSTLRRWFSSKSSSKTVSQDSDKCKKFGAVKKKTGCPKMKLKHCPPPARLRCDRLAKDIRCKKQEAPYPAYSEFCHEELDEKPSECKLCPWKPEENPNFKPQKKKLHTSSADLVRRSGLEVEETKESPISEEFIMKAEVVVQGEDEGMQAMRKPKCERPKSRRCPPKKEKKKDDSLKKKNPKPKKAEDYTSGLALILDDGAAAEPTPLELKTTKDQPKKKKDDKCKIKKFKFPGCDVKKIKEEQQKKDEGCPTKKKKKRIRDCPPSHEEGQKCQAIEEFIEDKIGPIEELIQDKVEEVQGFSLEGGSKKDVPQKCPKVDLTVWKQEDDRCKAKRKGTSKVCPGDLLKKKRRGPAKKDKKASDIITPVESQTEMPRPTKSI